VAVPNWERFDLCPSAVSLVCFFHRARKSLGEWVLRELSGKLRDELLSREVFYTLEEAKVLVENWRREYNTIRPHSSLQYRPPAPQARTLLPAFASARGGRLD